jgi:hypothetical protein
MRLFHYSEEPDIQLFRPRPSKYHDYPVVWAVGEEQAQNFLTPRECPRVTYGAGNFTSAEDAERWLGHGTAKRVIAIESGWLARLRACTLYEYTMPAESFEPHDTDASYLVSRATVTPMGVRVIPDLLAELAARSIELRVMPSLWRLRDQVALSTLRFSINRYGNAAPPEDGYVPRVPR